MRDVFDDARRGTLSAAARGGTMFADAAAEWLRFIEQDRERKPSTIRDYRSVVQSRLALAFGPMAIEEISAERVAQWRASVGDLAIRSKNKLLIILHGIFRRAQTVYGLAVNPLDRVENHPQNRSGDVEVFSPEDIWAWSEPRLRSRTARSS